MMNLLNDKYAGLGIVPACEGFDRRAGRRLPRGRAGRDRARARAIVATFFRGQGIPSAMVPSPVDTEALAFGLRCAVTHKLAKDDGCKLTAVEYPVRMTLEMFAAQTKDEERMAEILDGRWTK